MSAYTPSTPIHVKSTYDGSTASNSVVYLGRVSHTDIPTQVNILYGVPGSNIWLHVQLARQYLVDFPETNSYLQEPYIGDKTIISALTRILELANNTGAPITMYTLDNFPNKELLFGEGLMYAIYNALYQLEMRNASDISLPTGVQVSSARKASMFQQYANQYYQILMQHIARWKRRLNTEAFTEDW